MDTRSVTLIGLYAFVGSAIYVWRAIPPGTGWDGKIQWGDAATWIGAAASFSATAAALWIAGESNRKAARLDRKTATIIANALCDELRGNRAQLDHALRCKDVPGTTIVSRARAMSDSLKSVHITAFTLFKDQVASLDVETATAINTAYASLARCRDVEDSSVAPHPVTIDDLPWFTGYIRGRSEAVAWMIEEVKQAIVLLWPLVKERFDLPPPLTDHDEVRYAEALNARLAGRATTRDQPS